MRFIDDGGAYAQIDIEKLGAAWELIQAKSALAPAVDHNLMKRLLIWLFEMGIEDPQKLGSGLIYPENDSRCDADCGEEGVCASVVSGCDAPPVFELCEEVLDAIALSVEGLVVRKGCFSAAA